MQEPLEQAAFHLWVMPDGAPFAHFYRAPTGYIVRFVSLADFHVSSDGSQVTCWPAPGTTDGTIQHLYLNQVVPLAESRSGALMFHASAVAVGSGCIAFMGESGKGKSTLAASFAIAGHRFLTDDGLKVTRTAAGCTAAPSHPSIRLWEDSRRELELLDEELAAPVQFTSKSRLVAGSKLLFAEAPRPLHRIYVLGEDSASINISAMLPSSAVVELLRNSFLLDIEERFALKSHFDELTALARIPMFFRLDYPRRFEALPEVRSAVIEQAANAMASSAGAA